LADEVNGQEPDRQRQLGALKQGAGNQRGLVMTSVALEGLAVSRSQNAVGLTATARTAKARRPARLFHRCLALCFGPEVCEKLKHRHSGLKLNPIHGHDTPLSRKAQDSVRPPVAPPVSPAASCC
jgi:hypothetical protein